MEKEVKIIDCPGGNKTSGNKSKLNGRVIRQLLEDEAESLYRSSERHRLNEAMSAAAHDNAVREGVTRALFLLNLKLGV